MEKFLTSRKFLTTILAVVTELAGMASGAIDAQIGIAFVLTSVLAYVLTEGYVDAKRAAAIARTAATVASTAAAVLDEAATTIDKAAQP